MSSRESDTLAKGDLRRWLAKHLKMADVPESLWKFLEEEDYVEGVLKPSYALSKEEFLEEAKWLHRLLKLEWGISRTLGARDTNPKGTRDSHARTKTEQPVVDLPIDDSLTQRAWAFSLYLAKVAAEDEGVRQFRETVLGGATISREDAEGFLRSKAAAYYPPEWFVDNDVPFIGHTSQILEHEVVTKGGKRRIKGTMKISWENSELLSSFECVPEKLYLEFRDGEGPESVLVMRASVLARLGVGASKLAERYPWDPLEIPLFVLTGAVPFVPPIEGTTVWGINGNHEPIRMAVAPWVPVEEVSSWYKTLKKDLNTTTTPKPRRLALFMFVMSYPGVRVPDEGQEPMVPSWRMLMHSWNERYPKGHPWHYGGSKKTKWDPRNIRRDFLKAYNQVVNFYR